MWRQKFRPIIVLNHKTHMLLYLAICLRILFEIDQIMFVFDYAFQLIFIIIFYEIFIRFIIFGRIEKRA